MGQIESRHVPIFHTLETIERINQHIVLHQSAEHPDKMAIEQWQRIRSDLQSQLREMLLALDALPLSPKPEAERLSTDRGSKGRSMSPEHRAEIREARLAKRAAAISSGSSTPKPKKENVATDNVPTKRGMSPEHVAKIRETRMVKRTEPAITRKPKTEG